MRRPCGVDRVYLRKLDFRDDGLVADLEEVGIDTALRYRWVGNAVGNRPQMFLTTDNLSYLVGPSPVNLTAALERMGLGNTALCRSLHTILGLFFGSLPDGSRVESNAISSQFASEERARQGTSGKDYRLYYSLIEGHTAAGHAEQGGTVPASLRPPCLHRR